MIIAVRPSVLQGTSDGPIHCQGYATGFSTPCVENEIGQQPKKQNKQLTAEAQAEPWPNLEGLNSTLIETETELKSSPSPGSQPVVDSWDQWENHL